MAELRKGHAVDVGAKQKRVQEAVDCNDNKDMLSVTLVAGSFSWPCIG